MTILLHYHIGRIVLGDVYWSFGVVGLGLYLCCRLKQPQPNHTETPTHITKNNTTNVVMQQNSHKLPMLDILMSETC